MTDDEHKDHASAPGMWDHPSFMHGDLNKISPNATMFGMPNVSRVEAERSEGELWSRGESKSAGYFIHRKAKPPKDGSMSDASLIEPSFGAAANHEPQHRALMEMLLDVASWEDGAVAPPPEPLWGLDEPSKLQTRYDEVSAQAVLAHEESAPLSEEDLFGDHFPEDAPSKGVGSSWYGESGFEPVRQTYAGPPRSTQPGLDDITTPSTTRYYLLCEEADGSERRVLLDASLVKLVAQLIFERPA